MACLSSLGAAVDSTCLSWEVPIFLFLIGTGSWTVHWLWKHTRYQTHNFHLAILPQEPDLLFPSSFAEEPQCLKVLPCGGWHHLFVKVTAACGFNIKKVNCRLLDYDGSNASLKHQVQIVDIQELCVPGFYQSLNDGAFGQEYEYDEPKVLAHGEGIYLKVKLGGTEEWEGLLSFRAQDDTGFRSWARYAIGFRNA